MMQVLLCALNARFAHTNLAVRGLAAYLNRQIRPDVKVIWREWTINDRILPLLAKIAEQDADVYAFSCYIWNISFIIQLSCALKKIKPQVVIIWGGPEAGLCATQWLAAHPAVDYIICGEGEQSLAGLLSVLADRNPLPAELAAVNGLAWRAADGIRQNKPVLLLEGEHWSFPYTQEDLRRDRDRILYYEASRGCPFSCSYCLSSLERQVRYRPLEQVCAELARFAEAGVRQVKFVDRTFNCRPERARFIWQYLIRQAASTTQTCFHFEIAGDLLDDASLAILQQAPVGLFQFEIGVQSVNPDVLAAVNRVCDLDRLADQVKRLRQFGNCHVHLDLIAGLPGECLSMFGRSFNLICSLKPQTFQLGFLKLLPGTPIREMAAKRQYRWLDDPPYEVLQSDQMSFSDLSHLKKMAHLLDLYMNSNQARGADYLARFWPSPWAFYSDLATYFGTRQLFDRTLSVIDRLKHLFYFAGSCKQDQLKMGVLLDMLRTDYQISGQKGRPEWLGFWENSLDPLDRRLLRDLRLAARQSFSEHKRVRLRFDRICFNWAAYEGKDQVNTQDYLMVYDESGGTCRLAGQGPFCAGLPPLRLDQK